MDMGIISTWKRKYRGMMLLEIVHDIVTRQQSRDENSALKAGWRGLNEGYDPHMFDVANLVSESWRKISDMTVVRCWIKSKCLPLNIETKLDETFGKMDNTSQEKNQKF